MRGRRGVGVDGLGANKKTMLLMLLQAAAALKAVELHAFTKSRGGGNPASVALVADWPADDELVALAQRAEHGGPTAIVRGAGPYDVRYFACDGSEMTFCGHATLAAAKEALDDGASGSFNAVLAGTVAASRSDGAVSLTLEAGPASEPPPSLVDDALAVLRLEACLGAALYSGTDLVLEIDGDAYEALGAVDAQALKALGRVVSVTTRGIKPVAFRSRCFVGGAEDQACGVAHCGLGPYWAPRHAGAMRAVQDSPRGAVLDVSVDGAAVTIAGDVVRGSPTLRERVGDAARTLATSLIAPLPRDRSLEDEAKIELVKGGALRVAFIAGTALASAWSLTLFGARWQAPTWQAPVVKAPTVRAPSVRTPVFTKPQWRAKAPS